MLKDLAESVRQYGVTGNYTLSVLRQISSQALSPADWFDLAKACLGSGQYLEFKSMVEDKAQAQARQNLQNGRVWWTTDMLLGRGEFTRNQTNYPIEVHQQINEIFYKTWKSLPNKGEAASNLTKVVQGPLEPFSDFVARMLETAEKIIGNLEVAMPFVQQIIFEQSTKECQRAITPVKNKNLDAWLRACWGVGGPPNK